MNAVVDAGNSRYKIGLFEGRSYVDTIICSSFHQVIDVFFRQSIHHVLISSVRDVPTSDWKNLKIKGDIKYLNHQTPLPIQLAYNTSETLGTDRLAVACAAHALYPNQNCLIVDVGTCITYDVVDQQGTYRGGAISPGLTARLRSMHDYTARLPMVTVQVPVPWIGTTTKESMCSGAFHGLKLEISGFIDQYKKVYTNMQVLVCGGNLHYIQESLPDGSHIDPLLVLYGLNTILLYNLGLTKKVDI